MNKNKIDKVLNIKTEQINTEVSDTDVVVIDNNELEVIDNTIDELVPYTDNPELLKDIERYKEEREENITTLKEARESIKSINQKVKDMMKNDKEPSAKDIDAYAKIVNSLVNVTRELDEQAGPNKIEMYIDSKKKKNDLPQTVNNTQINITSTPANILKILEEQAKKNENKGQEEKV